VRHSALTEPRNAQFYLVAALASQTKSPGAQLFSSELVQFSAFQAFMRRTHLQLDSHFPRGGFGSARPHVSNASRRLKRKTDLMRQAVGAGFARHCKGGARHGEGATAARASGAFTHLKAGVSGERFRGWLRGQGVAQAKDALDEDQDFTYLERFRDVVARAGKHALSHGGRVVLGGEEKEGR
jgi:hypothetical protein